MAAKKDNPEVDAAAVAAENETLKAQLAALTKANEQAEADNAEAIDRIKISGGTLTMEQALQCVTYQRNWDNDPKNPNNKAPAAPAA